jgi:menaquinone-dependent protoporphyrinogen oxidase
MSTLIVFATTHGCTEKAAQILGDCINDEVYIVNLKGASHPDLSSFNTIIIGGSIHAGKIQPLVKRFCHAQKDILKQMRLGLFLCCMEEGEKAKKQLNEAYPVELREHAIAIGLFGGEFDFDEMNFLQRAIIKKIAGASENVSKIKKDNIYQFAYLMNQ